MKYRNLKHYLIEMLKIHKKYYKNNKSRLLLIDIEIEKLRKLEKSHTNAG